MNLPEHYTLFVISAFIASAFPGIAVMGAFTTSLKYGFKSALVFSLGLVAASLFYFIISGLGLIVLLEKYRFLFHGLKFLGIGYLLFLGIQSLLSKEDKLNMTEVDLTKTKTYWHLFISGFLIHLANPKNILFFVALLPQYLNLDTSIPIQIFWLALGSEIPELLLLLGYAYFAKLIKPILLREGIAKYFNVFIGLLFIVLAISLLFI